MDALETEVAVKALAASKAQHPAKRGPAEAVERMASGVLRQRQSCSSLQVGSIGQ